MKKIHPYADQLPRMSGSEYERLKSSIKEDGLIDPIVLYDDMVIDGRHRQEACFDVGIEPRYIDFDSLGLSITPQDYAFVCGLYRRHLITEQILLSIQRHEAMTHAKVEAKKRLSVAGKIGSEVKWGGAEIAVPYSDKQNQSVKKKIPKKRVGFEGDAMEEVSLLLKDKFKLNVSPRRLYQAQRIVSVDCPKLEGLVGEKKISLESAEHLIAHFKDKDKMSDAFWNLMEQTDKTVIHEAKNITHAVKEKRKTNKPKQRGRPRKKAESLAANISDEEKDWNDFCTIFHQLRNAFLRLSLDDRVKAMQYMEERENDIDVGKTAFERSIRQAWGFNN